MLTRFLHLTYEFATAFSGSTAEGTTPLPLMKKKSTSKSAFFNIRVLIAAVFCLGALVVALFAQTKSARPSNKAIALAVHRTPPAHRDRTSCKWLVPSGQPQICDTSLIFPTKGKLKSDV